MTKRARKPKKRDLTPRRPPKHPRQVESIVTPNFRWMEPRMVTDGGVFVGDEFICARRIMNPNFTYWYPCT